MPPVRERSGDESSIVTDVTVYGATSFVARHVLNYILEVASSASLPRKLKVTLAGRNETKLNHVLSKVEQQQKKNVVVTWDVFVAESSDDTALTEMATRTRVIINCAGPFELYSSGVVAACAHTGCDYVDITGEVNWVGDMRVKYGPKAAQSGARLIPMCGFDSIPSDLAVFAAVQALQRERSSSNTNTNEKDSSSVEIESARTWHSCFGGIGGGTLATMQQMKVDLRKCLLNDSKSLRTVPWFCFDPLVMTHPQDIRFNPDYDETRDRLAKSEWINLLPFSHTILKYGVSIPFFMAVANSKVVHASAIALKYAGPKFTYKERFLPLGFQRTLSFGLFSFIPSFIMLFFLAVGGLLIKLPLVGDFILKFIIPPGTGASDAVCEKGYAQVYAEVKSAPLKDNDDDKPGRVSCANAFLAFEGDPGNWVTSQTVVESALSLVFHRKELPTRSKDGFGTPAELLGQVLLNRLQNSKVRPVKVTTNVRTDEREHEYKLYM